MGKRTYLCIDLKSFYASVECVARGLDPMDTNLVVADSARTEKTICLAVSPSLKAYGIPGRARLFEVVQRVRQVNAQRKSARNNRPFTGASTSAKALKACPVLELSYIVATPRMSYYVECSAKIYSIYLRYFAPEDIYIYSIDEVFLDLTNYLHTYGMSARDLAAKLIHEILEVTGIPAAAGIGDNLYLCKVAMDIVAKHIPLDQDGVCIAQLDEASYRRLLWDHRPLTDFWRVGPGYAKKLEAHGMYTMGDVARCSLGKPGEFYNEDLLYRLFGVNAELLIDHAWGWEPCTMAQIKAYRPSTNSISSGQVLQAPYPFEKAKLIVREMADLMALDLVEQNLVTDQLVLTVGYDTSNLTDPQRSVAYAGPTTIDRYGRKIPKHAHGTANLTCKSSSTRLITQAVLDLFDKIVDPALLVRRVNLAACQVVPFSAVQEATDFIQLDLFSDPKRQAQVQAALERERRQQQVVLSIRKKYGKNAILKGMNLKEGATTISRHQQIGGHKA